MENPIKLPRPESILRIVVIFCLVGLLLILLAIFSRIGISPTSRMWHREFAMFFLLSAAAFGLFRIEYTIVLAITKRDLDPLLGYVQAFGCLLMFLYAFTRMMLAALYDGPWAAIPGDLEETNFMAIAVFSHIIFLANIVRSQFQIQPRIPVLGGPVPIAPARSSHGDWGWPSRASKLFGIAAIFFIVIGGIAAVPGFPVSRLPFPHNGRIYLVQPIYFCLLCAIPFVVFALLYRVLERASGWAIDPLTARVHFVCTIVSVVVSSFIYSSWARMSANTHPDAFDDHDLQGILSLLGLAVLAFLWNIWKSQPPAQRKKR